MRGGIENPARQSEAGAGRDRQSDRDLTLGWISEYESAVRKVKKENSGLNEALPTRLCL